MPATIASGKRGVAEAVIRRWSTPHGGLVDDPDYGYDVTDMVGADYDKSDLARIAHSLKSEAEKDERVLSCDVTVVSVADTLVVTGKLVTADGPFVLVASVSAISVSLLQITQ